MELLDDIENVVGLARVRDLCESGEARRIRLNAGLSQAEVAAPVGVSEGAVARWEAGNRRPHGAPAIRYLDLLDRLAASAGRSVGMTLEELRSSGRATITVRELAQLLEVGRNTTYAGLNAGEIPGRLKVGRRTLVAVPAVLGWLDDPANNAGEHTNPNPLNDRPLVASRPGRDGGAARSSDAPVNDNPSDRHNQKVRNERYTGAQVHPTPTG